MDNILHLFQAFVAPAIFVSAISLFVLSVNVRLMGIVSRLRQYGRARHDALRDGCDDEAHAYTVQLTSIERRAELMRRCFLFSLVALMGAILSCLLLGLGLYWKPGGVAAVGVFVMSLLCLMVGTTYYVCELLSALTAVKDEMRDLRFAVPPEVGTHNVV